MREGLPEDKIAALERYQVSDAFTPEEKSALRFAEQVLPTAAQRPVDSHHSRQ